ncbi:MAG: hypothetical protein ACFBSC_13055 [Microcoleaceae cyanobacterium]
MKRLAFTALFSLLVASPIVLNRKVILNCERPETDYVVCSREHQYVYGKFSNKTEEFKLANVLLESQLRQDDDGDYYVHEIHLVSSQDEKVTFYKYGRNKHKAQQDEAALKALIANADEEIAVNRGYLWNDLFLVAWPAYYMGHFLYRAWR